MQSPLKINTDTRIDLIKFELSQLYDWDRLHAQLRRRDLVFYFGVPSILIKLIGDEIFNLHHTSLLLAILGLIVSIFGFSISTRATQYVEAYKNIIARREAELGINLSKDLEELVNRENRVGAAQRTRIFHSFIIGFWVVIFMINFYTHLIQACLNK